MLLQNSGGINPNFNAKYALEELGISSRDSNCILRYMHYVLFKLEIVERFYVENMFLMNINKKEAKMKHNINASLSIQPYLK